MWEIILEKKSFITRALLTLKKYNLYELLIVFKMEKAIVFSPVLIFSISSSDPEYRLKIL